MNIAKKYLSLALVCCLPFMVYTQSRTDSLLYLIGSKMDSSLAVGSIDYYLEVFDSDYLFDELIIDSPEMAEYNDEFKQGNFIGEIAKAIVSKLENDDGSYDFINFGEDLAGYYLMFRMFSDNGANYHRYFLFENEDNELKIGDAFVVLKGDNISELMETAYLENAPNLPKAQANEVRSRGALFNMAQNFTNQGELEKARTLFKTIPEEIRNLKEFLVLEIQSIEDTLQLNAWRSRFEKAHPGNPAPYLLSMDYYLELGAHESCIGVVDSLDAFVDDDLLDFFRANILYDKKEFEKAIAYYEKVLENYPYFIDGLSSYLHVCIEAEEFEKTIFSLNNLLEAGYTKKEIKAYVKEDYPEYYKSQLFNKWLK